VLENLEIGANTALGRERWEDNLATIFSMFPLLKDRTNQLAGTLSGGEQQMLAIGRGLASAPKLLMLDEPSLGLAPAIVDAIFEVIGQIHRERGITVLLVEQRVAEAIESCNRGYVLESGRVVMTGTPEILFADERVKQTYLGM
jgi:branched-chain amino acid transport system ATP-binding protein